MHYNKAKFITILNTIINYKGFIIYLLVLYIPFIYISFKIIILGDI